MRNSAGSAAIAALNGIATEINRPNARVPADALIAEPLEAMPRAHFGDTCRWRQLNVPTLAEKPIANGETDLAEARERLGCFPASMVSEQTCPSLPAWRHRSAGWRHRRPGSMCAPCAMLGSPHHYCRAPARSAPSGRIATDFVGRFPWPYPGRFEPGR